MKEKQIKLPGPDHPISIERNSARVAVFVAGYVVADTRNALSLREADYPPVQYIPRVDVEEHEASRVQSETRAIAAVRGYAEVKTPLAFVRFEPFVVPKKSLTGDSAERVDTRVLQVIYQIEDTNLPLFVGQQMDVFIDASKSRNHNWHENN